MPITRVRVTNRATVEAAGKGDPAALEAVYRDLSPAVLGYLRAQGAREPEDLTSETFVGVVRGLRRFRGDEGDFRSWVFSIAHRRLVDERRSRARRPAVAIPPTEFPDRAGGDVEDEAAARMGARWVRDVVAQLTADQRDVLLLRILADLPVEDVARILDKTPGAVKSLQRRALLTLARHLDREGVS
jgi:RNA polymerase sigma factor (sigma-70 family)